MTCSHTDDCKIGMATHGACPACLQAANRDLRDAIRLILGRLYYIPWRQVAEADVDSYLQEIRLLKAVPS